MIAKAIVLLVLVAGVGTIVSNPAAADRSEASDRQMRTADWHWN